MNESIQLDFGFPRPMGPKALETVLQKEPNPPRRLRRYSWPETSARGWKVPTDRFLSWQSERAWEVGIPRSGPI